MKTLAKYHVCYHCVIGEKTFKNILIGPGKLPGLSRNRPQAAPRPIPQAEFPLIIFSQYTRFVSVATSLGRPKETLFEWQMRFRPS